MLAAEQTLTRLAEIPNITVLQDAPLARYTRFGIGGPADIYAEAAGEDAFLRAVETAREAGIACMVMGAGTNLIVSDSGVRGMVLRLVSCGMEASGTTVRADAGAVLQDLVDFTVERGLKGLETLAGIPGSVGAAIYGNAGAYGHAISERVARVRFFDGSVVRELTNPECEFAYRESVFKRRKEWTVFSVTLEMERGDGEELRRRAGEILDIRNRKFPATMKCAGSIFKNLLAAELPAAAAERVPPSVVREGKVPAAWFLEQVGAKGLRAGDIQVADYHANLIYNAGGGTAAQLRSVIDELKARVRNEFGLELEEEVQYVGFTAGK